MKILFVLILMMIFSGQSIAGISPTSCPKVEKIDISGKPQPIVFDNMHHKTLLAFLERLNYYHLSNKKIDDTFSQQFLTQYLKLLDSNKAFFIQEDIYLIETQYAEMLDDYLRQIDFKPLKEIYSLYRTRVINRLNYNINYLEELESLSFEGTGFFTVDRKLLNWQISNKKSIDYWLRRMKMEVLNLKLSGDTFQSAKQKVLRRYKTQLNFTLRAKPIQILDTYFNAMGSVFDPHTNYFSPQGADNFEINISLSLEGIGALLQQDDEYTKIIRIIPGGPASKEGSLEPGNLIVGVGEGRDCGIIDVVGWPLSEVVQYIRGQKGTEVRLVVTTKETVNMPEKRKEVIIRRDKVKLEDNAAKSSVKEYSNRAGGILNIGIIDLPSFYVDNAAMQRGEKDYRSTTRDVQKLLFEFEKQHVDGVVIDLRQNGGGSLSEVVTLTDLFIKPGAVVQIKNSRYRNVVNQRAWKRQIFDIPLVVLIDRFSASASEIFAAAIQDYGRGIIVGSVSFGKGTVQSVRPLPLGQAKITESKFYRVSGGSTQLKGVYPDIALPQFIDVHQFGESSLDFPLKWDEIRAIKHFTIEREQLIVALTSKHNQRLKTDSDLIYLQQLSLLNKKRNEVKILSLNEVNRRNEREKWREQELQIENNWRKQKGLPLKSVEGEILQGDITIEAENNTKTIVTMKNNDDTNVTLTVAVGDSEKVPDILLNEAGQILADMVNLQRKQVVVR